MKYRIKFLIIVPLGILQLLLLSLSTHGTTLSGSEKFYVHLNQPVYLTGETIWFKVYNTNYHELVEHSKIVYINLHDKDGKLVLQQKHKLTNGTGDGSMDIPISFHEDYYYLTCFTRWNLQYENAELTCIRIPIFNPFENSSTPSEVATSNIKKDPLPDGSTINIQLDKDYYTRKDRVEVNISPPAGKKYKLSISVHAMDHLVPVYKAVGSASYDPVLKSSRETSLTIEGNVVDPETDEPLISNVISLYRVGSKEFLKASSEDGTIHVPLEDFSGTSKYQIFNLNPYQVLIPKFQQSRIGEELKGLDTENLKRSPSIDRYLKDATINQRVSEIFDEKTPDSIPIKSFSPINLVPDKVYEMEKFHNMTTLEEFLREVVVYARLKEENGQPTVRLKNRETNRDFMQQPWYLVDGYLTKDEKAVLAIPFKNLKRVELFNTNRSILGQLEPVMIRSGLIAIYTNNNHLMQSFEGQENIFEMAGFSVPKEFKNAESEGEKSKENPDFRPSIYWNPNVYMTGKTSIKFNTSDFMGEYVIQIQAMDENGQIIKMSKRFAVGY